MVDRLFFAGLQAAISGLDERKTGKERGVPSVIPILSEQTGLKAASIKTLPCWLRKSSDTGRLRGDEVSWYVQEGSRFYKSMMR